MIEIQTFFENQVKLMYKNIFTDNRGFFIQNYDNEIKKEINCIIMQENISISKANVLRGLHYQWSNPMSKLVQCISGEIIDIVVDIRKDSKTLGEVKFFHLYKPNMMLWIPAGFAHGFYSKTDNTIVKYLCDALYNKEAEGAINFNDSKFKIIKNLDIKIDKLIISDKDMQAQSFENYLKQPKF
jgi:dTDP-4-dehydrorhamnose 3,5-epimerase